MRQRRPFDVEGAMKIRTDFVTNSSSSAFCVSFNMKFRNGEKLSCSFANADGDDDLLSIDVDGHRLFVEKCDLYAELDGQRLKIVQGCADDDVLRDSFIWIENENAHEHSVADVDLSRALTADELLEQPVQLCELDDEHFNKLTIELWKVDGEDEQVIRNRIIQSMGAIGAQVNAWQRSMKEEIASSLRRSFHSWEDVKEATVSFKDNGWGSEAVGEDALYMMIPYGSWVIIGSDVEQKIIVKGEDGDAIWQNIDTSIAQKYVAGKGVVYII